MKKLILLALVVASTQSIQAQSIAAGTISLGGGIGYSRSSNKVSGTSNNTAYSNEGITSQFSFTPTVGYFVADNLEVGLNLGYTSYHQFYTTTKSSPVVVVAELDPTTTLRVGPFVRYYKMLTEQFGLIGTLGLGYQNQRSQNYNNNNGPNSGIYDTKASGFYAGLTPGIVFFPIPKLGLSASMGSLGYGRLKYEHPSGGNTQLFKDYESNISDFGANFGLNQLVFGGTYYFGR
ncbi:hypothetical protein [Hymenobacter antarcticus]|uniref:Outer membrane protein beta-barrel domain-containing protein n=1 Tax=Hymenobacter antarcticus TaxID=486270 RepID=A0ABP7P3H3_9BACT